MKNTKKIGVLISLLLISLIAISAVSAAEDVAVDDVADVAAVEEVDAVDDAPATIEIDSGSDDIIDDSDSADLEDQIDDSANPKNTLKAEPLRAEDGTWTDLNNLISSNTNGTIDLDRNYVYNPSTDLDAVRVRSGGIVTTYNYYGLMINRDLVINGNGYTIDGSNQMRAFDIWGRYSVTLNDINFVNCNAEGSQHPCSDNRGGAIYASSNIDLTVKNCTFENNHAANGGVIYVGSGSLNATHCEFYNNSATYGGVIYETQQADIHVRGCAFINNTAAQRPNAVSGATYGDNVFFANGVQPQYTDYNENWWGTNYGPQYTIYINNEGAYYSRYDYYIATEILTSPITIEVNMVLDSGNEPTLPLEPRHAIVTNDADTCNTTEGWVPEAFTIEFTTSEDAYINVTVDNQYLILKVFAGENKKNITLEVATADVTLPDQPVVNVTSNADGIFNITLGDQVFEVEVIDGQGQYNFTGLPAGKYTIIVSRVDDPVYKTIFKSAEFEVKRYANELTISADKDEYTFGDDVVITPTFTTTGTTATPTGTITYFVDGAETGTEVDVGQDFVLTGLSAGTHNVTAKYGGDGRFDESESNILVFTVAKATLEINIANVTVNYPNGGTVNVVANKDGKYIITVDQDYEVNVVDGTGSFDVTPQLAVDNYTISWNIEETENYTSASGSAKYEVLHTIPEFSITGESEIDYNTTNTIIPTINSDATGTISYSVNGSEAVVKNVGENFVTDILPVGKYTVNATYSGDENYESASAVFEFEVLPIDVIVTVENVEVAYPNTGSVSVSASVPGTYTITINGKSYEVTVGEDGTGSVDVTDVFAVGKYDIAVAADLGDNYNPVSISNAATYTVTRANSTMTVKYEDGTFKVTLDGVNDEKLNETFKILIDNDEYGEGLTENGEYTFTVADLGPGKHSVLVIFDGNDNYFGSFAQDSFNLPKKEGAEVNVTTAPIKEGEEAVINITVFDGETGLNGVVTVTLDETDYAVNVTDGIGQLTVKNLICKDYPASNTTTYAITALFNGNDEYAEATGTGEQVVKDWNPVIIVIAPSETGAVATLIDTDLNNITGMVNVSINFEEPVEYPVENGIVDIPLSEGLYNVTVIFAGDDTHPNAEKTEEIFVGTKLIPTNVVVTAADITYGQNAEAVVILTAQNGTETIRLSGVVNLTVGTQSQLVTITNGEGKATFKNLNAGNYVIVADYAGDKTYAPAYGTAKLTVNKLLTRIVANNMTTTAINVTDDGRIGKWLTVKLVDINGNPLANRKIAFGFNAKAYNKTTDANGQASLQINLQKKGFYTFAISYLGDDNYNGTFEVVKVTVNQQKASMTASGATYKASAKTKTLSATLKTVAGNPMPGKKVTFTVNGKTYSATTDSNGVAKVNVSLTKAGSYSVEVNFAGTSTYEALKRKVTLKLT